MNTCHSRSILSTLLVVALSGCELRHKDACKWTFERADGLGSEGVCRISETEDESKPWSEAVADASGVLHVYYSDGAVYQERRYDGGRLQGPFRVWFPGGQIFQDVEYTNGLQNGKMVLWHQNGKQAVDARCMRGNLHGVYREWYANGQMRREARYEDGALDGVDRSWDERGRVVEDGVWRKLQPWEGRLIIYQRVGRPPVLGLYSNGVLVETIGSPSVPVTKGKKPLARMDALQP